MAKDFFQDITPPSGPAPKKNQTPAEDGASEPEGDDEVQTVPIHVGEPATPARGIRNIQSSRPRPAPRQGGIGSDMRAGYTPGMLPPKPKRPRSRWWLWGLVAACVLVLIAIALVALRSTTVTVTPISHTVVFSSTSAITAYPEDNAATGTLTYSVASIELEDSEVVQSQGTTTTPPTKASGEITVFNSYSTSKVDLVKNTRFATPDGLIFRTPEEIIVPGKIGSTPGQVTVSIVADQPGESYNVAATRFTVPGLQSTPAMYSGVYAKSTVAMAGGSSGGTGPAVDPTALAKARSDLHASLSSKAEDSLNARSGTSTLAFPELMQLTYTDEPNTNESGGGVRVHEKVDATAPLFPADLFAEQVAQWVSADAENASITLVPGSGFSIAMASSSAPLGQGPIDLALSGQALLIWNVDGHALAQALAGKDQSAFESIVATFPGVQEAHARVEPFWKSTFPTNPSAIQVVIEEPQIAQ